jgi:hypothetical protein
MSNGVEIILSLKEIHGSLKVIRKLSNAWYLCVCLLCDREYEARGVDLFHGRTTCCMDCTKRAQIQYGAFIPDPHRKRLLKKVGHAIERCHDPENRQYDDYGARGIAVHAPWREDINEFLRHLITLPGWDDPSLTLDREDNDKGYEPGNLRFVTWRKNQNNRRSRYRHVDPHVEEMKLAYDVMRLEGMTQNTACNELAKQYNTTSGVIRSRVLRRYDR